MNLDKNSQCNEIIQDKNTKMKQNTHINSLGHQSRARWKTAQLPSQQMLHVTANIKLLKG